MMLDFRKGKYEEDYVCVGFDLGEPAILLQIKECLIKDPHGHGELLAVLSWMLFELEELRDELSEAEER